MNYGIQVLEKEIKLIESALSNWDEQKYPEARKERDRRLRELEDVRNCFLEKEKAQK